MKTIIAPSYNRQRILRNLAKKNNGKLTDIQVLPFSTALHEESEDLIYTTLKIQKSLKDHIDEFPIYGKMIKYPSFLQEVIEFSKKCALYDITADDLPDNTPNDEELKQIISYVLTYPFVEFINKDKNKEAINKLIESDVEIDSNFINDPYHFRLLNKLKQTKSHSYHSSTLSPSQSLKISLNTRQEIEKIAQDIIKNNVSCNIILCDSANQYPVIEQVFKRYNIPFSTTCGKTTIQIPYMFSSLVQYAIKKDKDSFILAACRNSFSIPCPKEAISFLTQIYTGDSSIDISFKQFPKQQQFKLKGQQTMIDKWLEQIKQEKEELFNCSSPKDALISAYNILRNNQIVYVQKEKSAALNIRNTLSSCLSLIQSNDDVLTLLKMIETISTSFTQDITDFCTVTSLQNPIPAATNSYVVGCSGSNYPGYKAESGLFDETYVRAIKNNKFPSSEERFNQYNEQIKWIEQSATNQIIFSCPSNDYEGKDISPAFQIELMVGKGEIWKPSVLKPNKKTEHKLEKDTAKKIFTKNIIVTDDETKKEKEIKDIVTGSISSIEKYFKCPYSYFIQYGLGIREDQCIGLDSASIGTIQHSILEEGIKKYGKDISKLTKEEIAVLIEPSFNSMDALYPNEKEKHQLTKERLINSVHNVILFLADYEKNNSYKPKAQEKHFDKYKISDHVYLNGTIDRVDLHINEVRIIDYKSSSHSLSEPKIKAGLQLQLLSYLVVACKLFEATPAGAYYISLENSNSKDVAAKVTQKSFDKAKPKNQKKLDGWTYTKNKDSLDATNGDYISSLSKLRDYEETKKCINDLYEYFYNGLLNGNIEVAPIGGNDQDGACKYCKFKSVCRFHGEAVDAKAIVDYKLTLTKGGKE